MTDSDLNPIADQPAFPIGRNGCFGLVGGLLLVVAAVYGATIYPYDQDGDGVPDTKDVSCPTLAGGVWVSDGVLHGCPDPDSDNDGWFANIEGGSRYEEDYLDRCPDVKGVVRKSESGIFWGCPPPTPEEVAMQTWMEVENSCSGITIGACYDAAAKLVALPVAEQTEARKVKVHEAEQLVLVSSVAHQGSTKAQDIAAVEAQLAKVEDEAKRAELRVDFDRDLWVSYYYDCSTSNGVCDGWYKDPVGDADPQPMNRAEAFQKVSAFYDGDLAYPKPEDLVVELVTEQYKHEAGFLAAKEWGVDESRLRVAFGLDGENFTFSDDCDSEDAWFYGEAAKYGWFIMEAVRCARENEEYWRFKDAISFARMAGQPAEAARIERKLVEEALKRGEYSVTASGEPLILVENHEGWKVGS